MAADSMSLASAVLDVSARYRARRGAEILGAALCVLYASRNGLTDEETWGAAELSLGLPLSAAQRRTLRLVLRDMTMAVDGRHSFAHEELRRVVHAKYVGPQPERSVRLHLLLARYFGRLPATHRKVECLPYHLEVAGCWNKLKDCLVDIDMFDLWWTPRHREEFIELWASLARAPGGNGSNAGGGMDGMGGSSLPPPLPPRPCYDPVEEYSRSLAEHKEHARATDELVSDVILRVADFLLEFATRGHEAAADVPAFVHPPVPSADMAALGVPYLTWDGDGRTVFWSGGAAASAAAGAETAGVAATPGHKPNEEVPGCTTYFFLRWMWVHFPWVAVANCGARYLHGIELNAASEASGGGSGFSSHKGAGGATAGKARKPGMITDGGGAHGGSSGGSGSKSPTTRRFPNIDPLKSIPRRASAARPPARSGAVGPSAATSGTGGGAGDLYAAATAAESAAGIGADQSYWLTLVSSVHAEIQGFRGELDLLVQHRAALDRKLAAATDDAREMDVLESAQTTGEGRVAALRAERARVDAAQAAARRLARNFRAVLLMGDRHPAHCPPLVEELEIKLSQDRRLVTEIRRRLAEECYEKTAYRIDYAGMRAAVRQMAALQRSLVDARLRQHEALQRSNADDSERMALEAAAAATMLSDGVSSPGRQLRRSGGGPQSGSGRRAGSAKRGSLGNAQRGGGGSAGGERGGASGASGCSTENGCGGGNGAASPAELWTRIKAVTGLTDPRDVARKLAQRAAMEAQLGAMRSGCEVRLAELKAACAAAELELDETRYSSLAAGAAAAAAAGGGGKEPRALQARLAEVQARLKRARERAEAAEYLRHGVVAGLEHIAEGLGLPP
ncbi:unnamed protein product, partial [Phaeothamnion confervicola]